MCVHEEEAGPLHADLDDAQQGRGAGEASDFPAAAHVQGAFGQRQDVGDAGGARDGAEEDEHGAQAARGPARDDLVVLREVRHEDADDDEAARRAISGAVGAGWSCQRAYTETAKLTMSGWASARHRGWSGGIVVDARRLGGGGSVAAVTWARRRARGPGAATAARSQRPEHASAAPQHHRLASMCSSP